MAFEERMDALARAHQAAQERADREMGQIWQMLSDMTRRFETHFAQHEQLLGEIICRDRENQKAHERAFEQQRREIAELDRRFDEVGRRFNHVNDFINQLARIAGVHQHTLDDHEERIEDLEK